MIEKNGHSYITVYCKACGKNYQIMLRCKDIFCKECRRKRFYELYYRYRELLRGKDNIRMITLTVKNLSYDLDVNAIRLMVKLHRKSLRKLLRVFKEKIVGGIYCVQFTEKGRGWNLHFHLICEGRFIDVYFLSKKWMEITGDAVVDIRKVKNDGALKYVLRYLLRDSSEIIRVNEYKEIVKNLRMISKIGSYWGVKLKRRGLVCICGNTSFFTQFDLPWVINFGLIFRGVYNYNDTS